MAVLDMILYHTIFVVEVKPPQINEVHCMQQSATRIANRRSTARLFCYDFSGLVSEERSYRNHSSLPPARAHAAGVGAR